jgi:hypothetical protein
VNIIVCTHLAYVQIHKYYCYHCLQSSVI